MLCQNNRHQLWERGLIRGDRVHYEVPPWKLSRRSSNKDKGRSKGAGVRSQNKCPAVPAVTQLPLQEEGTTFEGHAFSQKKKTHLSGIREWRNWKDHSPGGRRGVGPPGAGRAGGGSPPQPKQEVGPHFWQLPCIDESK